MSGLAALALHRAFFSFSPSTHSRTQQRRSSCCRSSRSLLANAQQLSLALAHARVSREEDIAKLRHSYRADREPRAGIGHEGGRAADEGRDERRGGGTERRRARACERQWLSPAPHAEATRRYRRSCRVRERVSEGAKDEVERESERESWDAPRPRSQQRKASWRCGTTSSCAGRSPACGRPSPAS